MRRVSNPPPRWERELLEWEVDPPPARLVVYEDDSRSILAHNDSPDLGFSWSLNPYRGCSHGCAYCYARPSHEYLGFGAGTDFETRIVVKPDAPALLRRELSAAGWRRELIALSGDTDCYQPLEAHYQLTRRCLEVCLERAQPVAIVTRSALIERDLELLQALSARGLTRVCFSIPLADPELARQLEPGAPRPQRRFEAMRRLSQAGVPTQLLVAPLIPGLNDADVPGLLRAARQAGASWAGCTLLRLPGPVAEVFLERLREARPNRARRVESLLRQTREGRLDDGRFHHRMHGSGALWDAISSNFALEARRLGLDREPHPLVSDRPATSVQRELFEPTS